MELSVREAQPSSRRTSLIYSGLAILIGCAVGFAVTRQDHPIFIALAVGGLAVVIATVASAEFGLLLFLFITYTRFSDLAIDLYGAPSVAKFFVGLLIIAIIIRWALLGVRPQGWQVPAFLLALYGFVGFVSLIYAQDSEPVLGKLSDYVKDALIALVIVVLLKRGVAFRRVLWTLLAIGIFLGTLSSLQYLTGNFSSIYGGFAKAELHEIAGSTRGYRLTGPIGDANYFAQILIVLIPIAIDRILNERKLPGRMLAIWAAAVCILSVIFTFSRGGFIAMVAGVIIFFLIYPPRPLQLLVFIALGLALFALVPPTYSARILTLEDLIPNQSGQINVRNDSSFQGRADHLLTGWAMFESNPVFGIGLGNSVTRYDEFSKEIGLATSIVNRSLHSLYLEVLAETGILGFLAFFALIGYAARCVVVAKKKLLEASQFDYVHLVNGLAIGFISYLVSALFIHAAFPRYFYLLLGILYSLPAIAEQVRQEVAAQRLLLKPQQ
jgi:putative inorganic carbon (HCO3(-)) transporter